MQHPETILLIREEEDVSQGIPHILSNIKAITAIASRISSTLGPHGMDKMFCRKGFDEVTNDGATIMKNLQINHPAGTFLRDVSVSQDRESGDGTTSIVILTAEILKELVPLIKEGVCIDEIVSGAEKCTKVCIDLMEKYMKQQKTGEKYLLDVAKTSLSSKIVKKEDELIGKMIVDIVKQIPTEEIPHSLGIKKVPGGRLCETVLMDGVAFEKTFTYAGYEQQPKLIENPKVMCLNIELEWKKENAEIRIDKWEKYAEFINAEYGIIDKMLNEITSTGARVVLSMQPIGDLATQFFAKKGIFSAGRVAEEDMKRIVTTTGATLISTPSLIDTGILGSCALFEERQLGGGRYNFFVGGLKKAAVMILRGPGVIFLEEAEKSIHDAIKTVGEVMNTKYVVLGGGAAEMHLSRLLKKEAKKLQKTVDCVVMRHIAKALEVIPSQLAYNFGHNQIQVLQELRRKHAEDGNTYGVSPNSPNPAEMQAIAVYEPYTLKKTLILSAIQASIAILDIDSTIINTQEENNAEQ